MNNEQLENANLLQNFQRDLRLYLDGGNFRYKSNLILVDHLLRVH